MLRARTFRYRGPIVATEHSGAVVSMLGAAHVHI